MTIPPSLVFLFGREEPCSYRCKKSSSFLPESHTAETYYSWHFFVTIEGVDKGLKVSSSPILILMNEESKNSMTNLELRITMIHTWRIHVTLVFILVRAWYWTSSLPQKYMKSSWEFVQLMKSKKWNSNFSESLCYREATKIMSECIDGKAEQWSILFTEALKVSKVVKTRW